MTDVLYQKFAKQWEKVTELPPTSVGPLTPYYKAITKRLKVMPWPLLVVGAVVAVGLLYVLFGSAITLLVSLLQKGF